MDKKLELLRKIFKDKKKGEKIEILEDDFKYLEDYFWLLSALGLCSLHAKNVNWEIYCEYNGDIIINDIDKIFNGPLPVTFYLRRR